MRRSAADLLVVAGLALGALALALLGVESGALRVLLGLLLALALPGYALTAAAFADATLSRTDRGLFTIGFSLGCTILGGFVLNWSPWGLQRSTWTVLLTVITLGACVAAYLRRPARPVVAGRPTIDLSLGQAALFSIAGLAMIGAVLAARDEAALRPAPDVVQLWIMPGEQAGTVRVGVATQGPVDERYRLTLQRGGYIVREWPALSVARGEHWEASVELSDRQPGRGPLEARLYRLSEPRAAYRQVTLWLDQPSDEARR